MGKIIQLSEDLSNKIAAGEVVERPASVVKELVENAIDANSTMIEVQIEEAGLQKIRVIDNGAGMEKDDVLLAFERHATSKIKDEADLFRIQTLGFRGEALPSIASVAKVEMITSTGIGPGTRLVIEGGQQKVFEPAQSRRGTDFTVADLFYNTPARLKYMKSLNTELGKITDCMNKLALGHPDVAMKLTHNGRTILQTNGNNDPRQVLASIYGLNVVKKMIPIHAETLDFEIEGYITLPEITRASRNYIASMINGRFIKNYAINNSVISGYHTLLPIGRYPICYIHIKMDPILVDVNVHPAKLEVRLSKEKELCQLITETVQAAFKNETLIPSGAQPKNNKPKTEQIKFQLDHISKDQANEKKVVFDFPIRTEKNNRSTLTKKERQIAQEFLESMKEDDQLSTSKAEQEIIEEEISNTPTVNQPSNENDTTHTVSLKNIFDQSFVVKEENGESRQDLQNPKSLSRVPPLYPIGQMHGTYILAENENGLHY